jgi:hypothetical protein
MKLTTIGIALCATALAGCAAKSPEPRAETTSPPQVAAAPPALPSGTIAEDTLTADATVVAINQKTRHVTLKNSEGKRFTIVAGPEVRNLPQVKKGDVVRTTYHQSIAYEVKKAGKAKPSAAASTEVTRAELGEKPAAGVKDTVTVRFTITHIDKAKSEATLRDPDGKVNVVKVKDPTKLDAVHVGDLVDITYTEALAISVEKEGTK